MVDALWLKIRHYFFVFWTFILVYGGYGYSVLYHPEYTKWWKRTINGLIERFCDTLPSQLGAQVESTVGNFGIVAQLLLLTLLVRSIVGLIILVRRSRS
jgi:hypothetical protein